MVRIQSPEKSWLASNRIELKTFSLACFLVLAMEAGCYFLLAGKMNLVNLGLLRIFQTLSVLGVVYIVNADLQAVGLYSDQLFSGLKRGIIWSVAFAAVAGASFLVLLAAGISPLKLLHIRLPREPLQKVLFFMVGGLIAPVAEEIVFRGLLYGFFRKWGALFAIVASTLLFSLAHPGVSYVQITGGIVFSISYEKEKNMIVPITIHTLGNLALFSLSLFA